jgi:hypothetical protein
MQQYSLIEALLVIECTCRNWRVPPQSLHESIGLCGNRRDVHDSQHLAEGMLDVSGGGVKPFENNFFVRVDLIYC